MLPRNPSSDSLSRDLTVAAALTQRPSPLLFAAAAEMLSAAAADAETDLSPGALALLDALVEVMPKVVVEALDTPASEVNNGLLPALAIVASLRPSSAADARLSARRLLDSLPPTAFTPDAESGSVRALAALWVGDLGHAERAVAASHPSVARALSPWVAARSRPRGGSAEAAAYRAFRDAHAGRPAMTVLAISALAARFVAEPSRMGAFLTGVGRTARRATPVGGAFRLR